MSVATDKYLSDFLVLQRISYPPLPFPLWVDWGVPVSTAGGRHHPRQGGSSTWSTRCWDWPCDLYGGLGGLGCSCCSAFFVVRCDRGGRGDAVVDRGGRWQWPCDDTEPRSRWWTGSLTLWSLTSAVVLIDPGNLHRPRRRSSSPSACDANAYAARPGPTCIHAINDMHSKASNKFVM